MSAPRTVPTHPDDLQAGDMIVVNVPCRVRVLAVEDTPNRQTNQANKTIHYAVMGITDAYGSVGCGSALTVPLIKEIN